MSTQRKTFKHVLSGTKQGSIDDFLHKQEQNVSLTVRTGPTIRLRRESKKTCYHSGRSGTLVGQRFAIIVTADADCLPRTLTNPLLVCENGLSTLTQAALDAFCQKYHIPDVVHPELPAPNQSIHYIPAGKIGVYTRFFEFSNFRIPLYQFLVDVLGYFCINLSQLFVIVAAKVDASVFPLYVPWHTKKTITRDPSLAADEFSAEAFPLLESTRGRVITLAGESEQGGQHDNVEDAEPHGLNEEGGSVVVRDQTEGSGRVTQDEEVNIVVDEDVEAAVVDKPKVQKKRRRAAGASGSNHPPKQVGVTAAATMPFITSSVTLTLERESGGQTDSVSGPNLPTRRLAERFVISSDSSHHSSTNVVDVEVTSIVRSSVPPPPVLTAVVATTTIVGATSVLVHELGTRPVHRSIFKDSDSPSTAEANV
ncbi:hypothetical protein Tco_1373787, partial [Tanacetum coccineum]